MKKKEAFNELKKACNLETNVKVDEKVENLSENKSELPNCKIDKSNTFDIEVLENTDLRQQVKLINNGSSNWSKFFTFVSLGNSDKNKFIKGNEIQMKVAIKSGDSINVEVFIPAVKIRKGKYQAIWQMRNDKNDYFGEQLTLNITIKGELDKELNTILPITELKVEVPVLKKEKTQLLIEFGHQLKAMRSTFALNGIADEIILNALDETKGNMDQALVLLF